LFQIARTHTMDTQTLVQKYPPSPACSCPVCQSYCARPGWWTVEEAVQAIEAGYASRMMLEMSPDRAFGVLSPAFKGCEGDFAREIYSKRGCTFLNDKHCELHDTRFQPLECRFCHHARLGQGARCHAEIGDEWNSPHGRKWVVKWSKLTGLWQRLRRYHMI
jgi:hypothetical protein